MPAAKPPVRLLMSGLEIRRAVSRMAREIRAANPVGGEVALVGIQTGGVQLAQQLAEQLARLWRRAVPVGQLDIGMHRDDLGQLVAPTIHPTAIPFDVTGKTVVLVDDVLFSGRTTRAALDALNDFGRPRRTQLAVLVDRGHRELPIQPDFVGKTVTTALADRVDVHLESNDGSARVVLRKATRQAEKT